MALDLTPLDEAALPPGVRRVVAGPRELRELAARGRAPMPPADQVVALYQLAAPWEAEADEIAQAARATAAALPDPVLLGALGGDLDARVIDHFARLLATRPALLKPVLGNRATADETFAHLASVVGEKELLTIAANEQRLLRHPPIIAALYMNPKTPMSVAARAVELAVRNGVVVEGIPGFDDVRAAISDESGRLALTGGEDGVFASAYQEDHELPAAAAGGEAEAEAGAEAAGGEAEAAHPAAVPIGRMSTLAKIRLATVGNAFARAVLIRDPSRLVQMAAARAPGVNDNEVVRYTANRGLSEDVIRYLAGQRQFVRLYAVKLNLVNNPKCPLQASMSFLPHLTARDLRAVARSKQVPSALTRAAQMLVQKRDK